MENLSTRLRALLDARNGGNRSALARHVGVSPQAVQKWLLGETEPRRHHIDAIAAFLGVTPAMLLYGVDQASPPKDDDQGVVAWHPDDPLSDELVLIPESTIEFAAGNGREAIYEIVEQNSPATYRLSWLRHEGINPKRARRFRVSGESQEPFLFDKDIVLVNLDETEIIDGKLYAIRYDNDLRVKFLFKRLDGTLVLHSMNPAYPDEQVPPHLVDQHISIIGRVRDKSGKGGL